MKVTSSAAEEEHQLFILFGEGVFRVLINLFYVSGPEDEAHVAWKRSIKIMYIQIESCYCALLHGASRSMILQKFQQFDILQDM